jgi:hypothetical protein
MNVIQKETEKKLKCRNKNIEIKRTWDMNCFIVAVIIGDTGTVTIGLKVISGNNTRKASNRFSTNNSCTRNIAHSKESATI